MNAPSHWARVKLVSGSSGAAMWDLSSALPEARVTVGSGADAGWNVQAQGIAPVHFELYWDGKALWVGPPMAGTLAVDGQPVQAWRQLSGHCHVQFGGGAMQIETSDAAQMPVHQQATQAAAAPLTSQAALPIGSLDDFADDDATAIYEEGMVPPHEGGPAAPTPIGVAAPAAAAAGFAAPRLGTGVPQAPAAGRAAPPTVGFKMDDVTERPDFGAPPRVEFKTQVLDTSDIGVPLPSPAAGMQAAPPVAGPGGGAAVDQRPTLMQSSVSTDIIPKEPEEQVHVGPGGGAFALPPIPSALPEDGKKKGLERPPQRTMILFAITLLVALGALVFQAIQKKKLRAAAEADAIVQQERQAQEAQAIADELRQRIRSDRARVAQQQVAERERILGVLAEPLERMRAEVSREMRRASEEELAEAIREGERELIEKRAVEAVMINHLADALALYELLASDYPDPAYAATAATLRAKIECRRGIRRNGTECSQ